MHEIVRVWVVQKRLWLPAPIVSVGEGRWKHFLYASAQLSEQDTRNRVPNVRNQAAETKKWAPAATYKCQRPNKRAKSSKASANAQTSEPKAVKQVSTPKQASQKQ